MKKIALLVGLVLAAAVPARAGIYYDLAQSASSMTWRMVGISKWFASSTTGSPTVTVDGANGGIAASSATFTATGANIFSVRTSSGINVAAGGVYAPFFSASTGFFGSLFGNAATATLATTATNLASGAAGSVPYQTGSGATAMLAAGAAGAVLNINAGATAPAWTFGLVDAVKVSTANVSPGLNGASQLVQLTAATKYPALDGSLITNLAGVISGLTSGKVTRGTSSTSIGDGSFFDNGSGAITIPATSSVTYVAGSTDNINGVMLLGSTGSNGMQIVSDITQGGIGINMLSIDGAAISSGAIVVVDIAGTAGSDYLTFTSTTSGAAGNMQGVTMRACGTNAPCPIGFIGIFRVKCITGLTVGFHPASHTTRYVATHLSAIQVAATGTFLRTQSSGSDGWCTVLLGRF